jgi:hypothetical protein
VDARRRGILGVALLSCVGGTAELAAFLLQDRMLPEPQRASAVGDAALPL